MGRVQHTAAILLIASSLGACATITRGRTTAWTVNTTPMGASVQTSVGFSCNSTPCSIVMPRRSTFIATITKPGYKPVSVDVSHHLSTEGGAAFLGNALIGGVLGASLDIWSGATEDLTPNDTTLRLEQDGYADWSGANSTSPVAQLAANIEHAPVRRYVDAFQISPTMVGRVVEVKVMADGAVRETREAQ